MRLYSSSIGLTLYICLLCSLDGVFPAPAYYLAMLLLAGKVVLFASLACFCKFLLLYPGRNGFLPFRFFIYFYYIYIYFFTRLLRCSFVFVISYYLSGCEPSHELEWMVHTCFPTAVRECIALWFWCFASFPYRLAYPIL